MRNGWRKMPGVPLPYAKQMFIRSTCVLYDEQPEYIKKKIHRLCDMCGGPYSAALYDVMCTEKSLVQIAQQHYVSERVLCDIRRAFYINW